MEKMIFFFSSSYSFFFAPLLTFLLNVDMHVFWWRSCRWGSKSAPGGDRSGLLSSSSSRAQTRRRGFCGRRSQLFRARLRRIQFSRCRSFQRSQRWRHMRYMTASLLWFIFCWCAKSIIRCGVECVTFFVSRLGVLSWKQVQIKLRGGSRCLVLCRRVLRVLAVV